MRPNHSLNALCPALAISSLFLLTQCAEDPEPLPHERAYTFSFLSHQSAEPEPLWRPGRIDVAGQTAYVRERSSNRIFALVIDEDGALVSRTPVAMVDAEDEGEPYVPHSDFIDVSPDNVRLLWRKRDGTLCTGELATQVSRCFAHGYTTPADGVPLDEVPAGVWRDAEWAGERNALVLLGAQKIFVADLDDAPPILRHVVGTGLVATPTAGPAKHASLRASTVNLGATEEDLFFSDAETLWAVHNFEADNASLIHLGGGGTVINIGDPRNRTFNVRELGITAESSGTNKRTLTFLEDNATLTRLQYNYVDGTLSNLTMEGFSGASDTARGVGVVGDTTLFSDKKAKTLDTNTTHAVYADRRTETCGGSSKQFRDDAGDLHCISVLSPDRCSVADVRPTIEAAGCAPSPERCLPGAGCTDTTCEAEISAARYECWKQEGRDSPGRLTSVGGHAVFTDERSKQVFVGSPAGPVAPMSFVNSATDLVQVTPAEDGTGIIGVDTKKCLKLYDLVPADDVLCENVYPQPWKGSRYCQTVALPICGGGLTPWHNAPLSAGGLGPGKLLSAHDRALIFLNDHYLVEVPSLEPDALLQRLAGPQTQPANRPTTINNLSLVDADISIGPDGVMSARYSSDAGDFVVVHAIKCHCTTGSACGEESFCAGKPEGTLNNTPLISAGHSLGRDNAELAFGTGNIAPYDGALARDVSTLDLKDAMSVGAGRLLLRFQDALWTVEQDGYLKDLHTEVEGTLFVGACSKIAHVFTYGPHGVVELDLSDTVVPRILTQEPVDALHCGQNEVVWQIGTTLRSESGVIGKAPIGASLVFVHDAWLVSDENGLHTLSTRGALHTLSSARASSIDGRTWGSVGFDELLIARVGGSLWGVGDIGNGPALFRHVPHESGDFAKGILRVLMQSADFSRAKVLTGIGDTVWIATPQEIYEVNISTGAKRSLGLDLPLDSVSALALGPQGYLWVRWAEHIGVVVNGRLIPLWGGGNKAPKDTNNVNELRLGHASLPAMQWIDDTLFVGDPSHGGWLLFEAD